MGHLRLSASRTGALLGTGAVASAMNDALAQFSRDIAAKVESIL